MAVARKPDFAEAVFNLASHVRGARGPGCGGGVLERARELELKSLQAGERLASLKGKRDASAAGVGPAAARGPGSSLSASDGLAALGETLRLGGRPDDAAAWYRVALRLNPRMANAYTALGAMHADAGRFDEAIDDLRRAPEIDRNFHVAREYRHCARRVGAPQRVPGDVPRSRRPVSRRSRCSQRSSLQHAVLAERQRGATFSPRRARGMPGMLAPRRAGSATCNRSLLRPAAPHRLRVTRLPNPRPVSSRSPCSRTTDHRQFEILCYSSADRPDHLTERIRGYADVFREVAALDDAALSEVIRRDQIDILVDLTHAYD